MAYRHGASAVITSEPKEEKLSANDFDTTKLVLYLFSSLSLFCKSLECQNPSFLSENSPLEQSENGAEV